MAASTWNCCLLCWPCARAYVVLISARAVGQGRSSKADRLHTLTQLLIAAQHKVDTGRRCAHSAFWQDIFAHPAEGEREGEREVL